MDHRQSEGRGKKERNEILGFEAIWSLKLLQKNEE
jgi:hypothetical protein